MYRIRIFLIAFILSSFSLSAQNYDYKFRLMLTDKGDNSAFSTDNPEAFLSQRAIDRRIRQNIPIDESDLPISDTYITQIENLGCTVVAKSKWLKSVSVYCSDSLLIDQLLLLPFVKSATFVWRGETATRKYKTPNTEVKMVKSVKNSSPYGYGYDQIALNNGQKLHEAGYKGEGMQIAIIDAGYSNLPMIDQLKNINILGVKDFVYEGGDIYTSNPHGTHVLSTMASNIPDTLIGTAPNAGYWLLRSEDAVTEYPIEEDYWVAAAEYADSIGADLINTSLGYTLYDFPAKSYTYNDMNGKTAFISQGADYASQKGLLVVASAGNERNKPWVKIGAPADAQSVLTVGAVKQDSLFASFSSQGPSSDLRTKPDVMAKGADVSIIMYTTGQVASGNGTSYSSPIMCGMVACLWQAFPLLTNKQICDIVKQSSNYYTNPNDDYGYGLPDMEKAIQLAQDFSSIRITTSTSENFTILSDSYGRVTIRPRNQHQESFKVNIYSVSGTELVSETCSSEITFDLGMNRKNVYLIVINGQHITERIKAFF